jgi:hypothetical protein
MRIRTEEESLMKRSTGYWSTALAAAALIALPATGFGQPPASSQSPQPTTQTSASQSAASQANPQTPDTATSPADHVREAKQALSSIPQNSIPAKDRAQFAQLRRHLNNLEREVANGAPSATASASATPASRRGSRSASSAPSWASDAAAIDSILSKMIGPETGSAASGEAVGTTGTERPSATAGSNRTASSLDEATKDKLREVRRHVTELASSMSGTAGASRNDTTGAASSASNPDVMGSAPSSSQSATPQTTTPQTTTPQTSTPTSGSTTEPQSDPSAQPPSTSSAPQVDAAAAKQHLSEARDALSQLTTLPEASKLQGEARTQVSQLISNFNELITTQSNWRDAYEKVEANLNILLGPDASAGETPGMGATTTGTTPPTPTGTTGTMPANPTGTTGSTNPTPSSSASPSGAVQLDPAIRAKLVEFRTHLKAFEQAAGGSASSAASAMPPAAATSAATNPANPTSAMPSSQGSTQSAAASTPSTAAGTSGSAATAPTPADTSAQSAKASEQAGHAQADKELDAIQAILDKAKDGTLDKSDTDQLKAHIAQLRQLLAQSGGGR